MERGGIIIYNAKSENLDVKKVLCELEEINEKMYMFNIKPDAGRFLHLLVKVKQPKNIIEIGTSNGYSTIWVASASEKAKVYTIEIDDGKAGMARENFCRAGLKNIELLQGDALNVLKNFKVKVDMIFLDAMKKDYIKYIKMLEKNMNENCVIIADNVISHNEKVSSYIAYMKKNYSSETLQIGAGLELSVKTTFFS